ncbi:MAG: alpha/beta hydrolase [Corynebacterium sp.]|uniref:alpha/beta hydrolase n=1 Tax=Corynebacterium sp. TaxID=1720 RepID=UPI0026DC2F8B|nr:alpha/beta hydrolase [Corynebacterium sp.]MDO5029967.1 alpha/beta hydrolase [Corynebacterium sp.]
MRRASIFTAGLATTVTLALGAPAASAAPLDFIKNPLEATPDPQSTAMVELPTTPAPTTTNDGRHVTVNDGYMTSTDGKDTPIYWKSNTIPNAKGTVVVVHGAAEHLGRYEWVTGKLLNAGYNVYRLDHRGHGHSGQVEGTPVARGHIDDFHSLVDDLHQLVEKAKSENPSTKTFLLGHSMGGLAVDFHGIKYPGSVDGIIANGGGALFNPYGGNEKGETITPEKMTDVQREAQPTLYQRLPFQEMTTFNARLLKEVPQRTEMRAPSLPGSDLIQLGNPLGALTSSSQAVRDEYDTDPYNNPKLSLGMAQQLAFAATYNGVNSVDFKEPTLVMMGGHDELVPPFFSRDFYNGISSSDKKLVEFEGQFHEVFNEPAQQEAINTVITWLNERA